MKDNVTFKTVVPQIKGHYKIELHNAKTGELEHCVEGDNHINQGFFDYSQRKRFYGLISGGLSTRYMGYSMGVTYPDGGETAAGSRVSDIVLSYQDATDIAAPADAPCWPFHEDGVTYLTKAHCQTCSSNLGANAKLGLFNATDSYTSPQEIKIICDWTTEKGNGLYNSISIVGGAYSAYSGSIFSNNHTSEYMANGFHPNVKPIQFHNGTVPGYGYNLDYCWIEPNKSYFYYLSNNNIIKRNLSTGVETNWFSNINVNVPTSRCRLEIDNYDANGNYDIAYVASDSQIKIFHKSLSADSYVGTLSPITYSAATFIYSIYIYNRKMVVLYRTSTDNQIALVQYDLANGNAVLYSTTFTSGHDATDYVSKWMYIPTTNSNTAFVYRNTVNNLTYASLNSSGWTREWEITLSGGTITNAGTDRLSKYHPGNCSATCGSTRMFIHSANPATYFVGCEMEYRIAPPFAAAETTARIICEHVPSVLTTRNLSYCTICLFSQTFPEFEKVNTQTMKVIYTITISEA